MKGCAANLNIAVFKEDNFDEIKEFINKKKLKAYKALNPDLFADIVNKYSDKNNITAKEALNDRKHLNAVTLLIEREVGR